ncbi:hypothetical protein MYP_3289 [Sporocytophaga myxococcoides]|uniref:Uncharacterized protein n=1 Tax=Sporocytophaga myxococcoides TaxID=153721 RepID=A0A098LGG8_9BACT|nr:hypothetical protein MYP_3289 [Sporocytophaga myxococcoides]
MQGCASPAHKKISTLQPHKRPSRPGSIFLWQPLHQPQQNRGNRFSLVWLPGAHSNPIRYVHLSFLSSVLWLVLILPYLVRLQAPCQHWSYWQLLGVFLPLPMVRVLTFTAPFLGGFFHLLLWEIHFKSAHTGNTEPTKLASGPGITG